MIPEIRETHGIVRGRTIELDEDPLLPAGHRVVVSLQPEASGETRKGLLRAAGSWQDMPHFEEWLAETYRSR